MAKDKAEKERSRKKRVAARRARDALRRDRVVALHTDFAKGMVSGGPAAFARLYSADPRRGTPIPAPEHYGPLLKELKECAIAPAAQRWTRLKSWDTQTVVDIMLSADHGDNLLRTSAFPSVLFERSNPELWLDLQGDAPRAWLHFMDSRHGACTLVIAKSPDHPVAGWAISGEGPWYPLTDVHRLFAWLRHVPLDGMLQDPFVGLLQWNTQLDLETALLNPSPELEKPLELYRTLMDEPLADLLYLADWHEENEDLLDALAERSEQQSRVEREAELVSRTNQRLQSEVQQLTGKLDSVQAALKVPAVQPGTVMVPLADRLAALFG